MCRQRQDSIDRPQNLVKGLSVGFKVDVCEGHRNVAILEPALGVPTAFEAKKLCNYANTDLARSIALNGKGFLGCAVQVAKLSGKSHFKFGRDFK
jgi:hypothetical protein